METRETISLDARAQQRIYVLNHVLAGALTAAEAGRILKRSERQIRRLLDRYRVLGAAGLVHGNRGRAPAHRTPDELRARLIELATTTYAGVNRAHLAELLAEREGLPVAERTLRRLLAEGAVPAARTRRPGRHRRRRERMAREGQLVQTDGSQHHWFGPERPFATLIGIVDDATGKITGAMFRAAEDAAGYFTALSQTAAGYGLPGAVYSDRHGIFIADQNRTPTLAEQLTGKRSLTQVGRALDQAAIGWIGAHSAPAKGRVERGWGTLQDRLVVELRLGRSPLSRTPTPSCPASSAATTRASPSRPRCPSRPGGRGPTGSPPRRCSASTTRAGPAGTPPSAGAAGISSCLAGQTAAAGPARRWCSRSDSTAACGSITAGCASRSHRRQPDPVSCAPASSPAAPRARPTSSDRCPLRPPHGRARRHLARR
ncbi:MAG: ISNCY family transposase [Chloroflexi bacterium]|nr:ISNCY family transposase [Chloroflexota bacterium]